MLDRLEEHLYSIDEIKNQSKFYDMLQLDEDNFIVQWGRIGNKPQSKIYPMKQWNKIFMQKLDKGYLTSEYSQNEDFNINDILYDFNKGAFD